MTTLASILKNQTVRIDNHDSGSGREFKWGTGVHIHKIMNEKKYKGAEFTLPLDRPGTIKYIRGNTASIEREIRKAFDNEGIRKKFISSFGEALKKIADANNLNLKARTEILKQSSKQLIELFGMDYELNKDWFRDDYNFMSMFTSPSQPDVYIEQNTKEKRITISPDEMYIELFNTILKEKDKEDEYDAGM